MNEHTPPDQEQPQQKNSLWRKPGVWIALVGIFALLGIVGPGGSLLGLAGGGAEGCEEGSDEESGLSTSKNALSPILGAGNVDDTGNPWGLMGCYMDVDGDRDLPFVAAVDHDGMNPDLCIGLCRDQRYHYAGVQYGNQCYCGNAYGKHGEGTGCDMPCGSGGGDTLQECGGNFHNSVYSTRVKPTLPLLHLGCYQDNTNISSLADRDLSGLEATIPNMTISSCVERCATNGYAYAGVQYGNQCYCGDSYGAHDTGSGCDVPCAGDSGTTCGGSYHNNVYATSEAAFGISSAIGCFADAEDRDLAWEAPRRSLGCFQDNGNDRALDKAHLTGQSDMTVGRCIAHCRDLGHDYAGVQNGNECWCGDDNYGKHGTATGCGTPCAGNSTQICGGAYQSTIYRTKDAVANVAMAPVVCQDYCLQEGYAYSGVQYGNQCFCGNTYGKYGEQPNDCTMPCAGDSDQQCGNGWRNSVSSTSQHVGCFKDGPERDLPVHVVNAPDMTPTRCASACRDRGYPYAGVQYGNQCFCGDTYGQHGAATDCDMPCAGDASVTCGDSYRNNIYLTAHTLGCFVDATTDVVAQRDLSGVVLSSEDMTVGMCMRFCGEGGYDYAGVQNGSECFCGHDFGKLGRAPAEECDTACAGDSWQRCGGYYRNNIYSVVPSGTNGVSDGLSVTPEAIENAEETGDPCTLDTTCPAGQEFWGGLCFPACQSGTTRTSPFTCQSGAVVTDFAQYGNASWPDTSCPSGTDYYGEGCYRGCPGGWSRTAVCTCDSNQEWRWEPLWNRDDCPGGWRPAVTGCQTGGIVTDCGAYGYEQYPNKSCGSDKDWYGGLCYGGKCPSGSTRTAVATCDSLEVTAASSDGTLPPNLCIDNNTCNDLFNLIPDVDLPELKPADYLAVAQAHPMLSNDPNRAQVVTDVLNAIGNGGAECALGIVQGMACHLPSMIPSEWPTLTIGAECAQEPPVIQEVCQLIVNSYGAMKDSFTCLIDMFTALKEGEGLAFPVIEFIAPSLDRNTCSNLGSFIAEAGLDAATEKFQKAVLSRSKRGRKLLSMLNRLEKIGVIKIKVRGKTKEAKAGWKAFETVMGGVADRCF